MIAWKACCHILWSYLTYGFPLPYRFSRFDRSDDVQRGRRSDEDALVMEKVVYHRYCFCVGDLPHG